MSGNEKIADFVVKARWKGLPESVRCRLRMCLMDSLGAEVSGKLAKVSQIATRFASKQESANRSSILLNGEKVAPAMAGFANVSAANALDFKNNYPILKF